MKIVYVNDVVYKYAIGDPSANGGAERYGWYLMRALAQTGWSATVGVLFALQEGETRVVDGVRFVGLTRRQHFLLDWYSFLKSERPDWCFWQCADHLWGPAAEIARCLDVRTAFSSMHDLDVQVRKAQIGRRSLWPLYLWGLERSNLIFIQHYGQREYLPLHLQKRTYLLPGIVLLPERVIPHQERNGTVVWAAVIRPPKRPDLLIEIARRLPTVHFVVCGAPRKSHWDPQKIDQIMQDLRSLPNVDCRGHVAPEQTVQAIGNAGLLLSTSDGEGFPSVFLEAWAAGTPVVSMQIDPDHKIRDHELGKVADTIEGAVEAVRLLVASPERCHEMGIRSRRHVEEIHSPASAVQAFDAAVAHATAVVQTRSSPVKISLF